MDERPPADDGAPDEMTADRLLPLVYNELRRLAEARMMRGAPGVTLQPTALVHDAWIRLGQRYDQKYQSREHFFNAAALTMRRILVDRARQKHSRKHGGVRIEFDPLQHGGTEQQADERVLLMDEALRVLGRAHPDDERIVTLKFFAGLEHKELAETLGVSERTVERKLSLAKARLFQIVRNIEPGGS